jgi:two-component system nitrogen regulation sensor histidine kinase GlnL
MAERSPQVISASVLLAELPSAVLVVSRDYTLEALNPAAEDLLGGSEQALIGKELAGFFYPLTQLLKLIDLAFETGQIVREFDMSLSSGRGGLQKRVHVQISPLRLESRTHFKHVIVQIDVLSLAPQSVVSRNTKDSKNPLSGMAAILAHEVKNPLSGIRGAAQLLEKHVAQDQQRLTHLIRDEVDRITALLNEMEIFSNESSIKTSAVNVHEVLQYVKSVSENGFAQHIDFQEIYDPSLPLVEGNRDLLVQVFLNLFKNAAEALTMTKHPVVRLVTTYSGGVKFKPLHMEHYVSLPIAIYVEDNGPGIPDDIQSHLFTPFMTSKEGGQGLGLAIVSKIVADHMGTIEVERTPSGHTRFKILLPAAKE